jgi:hypothetical protein
LQPQSTLYNHQSTQVPLTLLFLPVTDDYNGCPTPVNILENPRIFAAPTEFVGTPEKSSLKPTKLEMSQEYLKELEPCLRTT